MTVVVIDLLWRHYLPGDRRSNDDIGSDYFAFTIPGLKQLLETIQASFHDYLWL